MHSADNDNCEVDSQGLNEGGEFTWNYEECVEPGEPVVDDLESFVMEDLDWETIIKSGSSMFRRKSVRV